LKLTKNGEHFFCNCTVITFGDDVVQSFGVTDHDIQELINEDYITYDEDTGQYFWTQEGLL